MGNKVLALLMVVAVAGIALGCLWLLTPGDADASGHSATRSFSSSSVDPGEEITVTIRADNYGGLGRIVETLPSGFTSPDASDQTVKLRLLQEGPQTRSYTVTASNNPGSYTFLGLLQSEDKSETQVLGSSSVTVRVAAPEPEPQRNRAPAFPGSSTTRSIDENSASGANVGAAVRATDADGDRLTYSLTGTDAGSFTINSGGQIMVGTGTMLDYETKDSYEVTVTATDPDSASAMITVTVTVTNLDEAGTVTLSSEKPTVGYNLTTTPGDPDGDLTDVTWQWSKSANMNSWMDISGATSMSYTPTPMDVGYHLRATATYTDPLGSGKTARAVSDSMTTVDPLIVRYDTNSNGLIERNEVIKAITDYLFGEGNTVISKSDVIKLITLYLFG